MRKWHWSEISDLANSIANSISLFSPRRPLDRYVRLLLDFKHFLYFKFIFQCSEAYIAMSKVSEESGTLNFKSCAAYRDYYILGSLIWFREPSMSI